MNYRLPLSAPTYDDEETLEVISTMESRNLTMGEKVKDFEKRFSNYVGSEYAVMVNSGSTANLLAMTVLAQKCGQFGWNGKGFRVVVPALTWATHVSPVILLGGTPVFADVSLENLGMDPESARICVENGADCLFPAHILGMPAQMKELSHIASAYSLSLFEDCCESLGSVLNGTHVGLFGDMGTFSFYFSHHMTTIEGGMIVTNNKNTADLLKSYRNHGMVRDLEEKNLYHKQNTSLDPRFFFQFLGYNVRPMEIQGALGIVQIQKLKAFLQKRRRIYSVWANEISKTGAFLVHRWEGISSAFAFPITLRENNPSLRNRLMLYLEKRGIETRPLVAGNLLRHPAFKNTRHSSPVPLKNADFLADNSFYIGLHDKIDPETEKYVIDTITEGVRL